MIVDPKMLKLAENLLSTTESDRLQWSEAGRGNSFKVDMGYATVIIEQEDESNHPSYSLTLKDQNGETLEVEFFDEGPEYDVAKSLFILARRGAKHVDAVLDRVIADLEAQRT